MCISAINKYKNIQNAKTMREKSKSYIRVLLVAVALGYAVGALLANEYLCTLGTHIRVSVPTRAKLNPKNS